MTPPPLPTSPLYKFSKWELTEIPPQERKLYLVTHPGGTTIFTQVAQAISKKTLSGLPVGTIKRKAIKIIWYSESEFECNPQGRIDWIEHSKRIRWVDVPVNYPNKKVYEVCMDHLKD